MLGYLAFRGIENDRALLEKEVRNEHVRLADAVTQSLQQHLLQVEQTCWNVLYSLEADVPEAVWVDSMRHLEARFPAVEALVRVTPAGRVELPATSFLFSAGDEPPTSQAAEITSDWFFRAQNLEFQQQRLEQAVTAYRRALRQTRDRRGQARVLTAIARVQTKLARASEALVTYRKLVREYAGLANAGGLPVDLAAHLQMAQLHLLRADSTRAAEKLLRVERDLVAGTWRLERSQYEFISATLRQRLDALLSHSPSLQAFQNTWQTLRERENVLRRHTNRLLHLRQMTPSDLMQQKKRSRAEGGDLTTRLVVSSQGWEYWLSFPSESGETRPSDLWGILWRSDYFAEKLLPVIIQANVRASSVQWRCQNRDGEVVAGSPAQPAGFAMVSTPFVDRFPPWRLQLFYPETLELSQVLRSRKGVYIYIFLAIAGILVLGLTLTVRGVTQELELAKLKSDFVSTISHELRSPLTSIRQLAEMLQRGRVAAERRQKYYDVLVEQSERLARLVNSVLDFAKMEEGRRQFVFERIPFGQLLEDILLTLQPRLQHEGFDLEAQIEPNLPSVSADRLAMSEVVTNLLDNAMKYSGSHKKIRVYAYHEGSFAVLSVQDFGPGIPKKEQSRIFERFYRAAGNGHRSGGTGLGLTLVKQIVEAHKGRVHVESEPGEGSTFIVRLPSCAEH